MEVVKIKQEDLESDVLVKCEVVKEESALEEYEWGSGCVRVEEAGGQPEGGVCAAAAWEGLYTGHEVKSELVLGPTLLQPPDAACAPPPSVSCVVAAWAGLDLRTICERSRLRACSVRLKRLPPDILATLSASAKRQTNHGINQDTPASHLYSCGARGEQSSVLHSLLHNSGLHAQAPAGSVPNVVPIEGCSAPGNVAEARAYTGDKPSEGIPTRKAKKPHKCDICQKQFTRKSGFIRHVRIHTGEKQYKCNICQKQFTRKSDLIKHVRIHIGEKPYKCDICQKQFIKKCFLISHMRVHTKEKTHNCDICQEQFSCKCVLIRHVSIHTGVKLYKCDICQKQFLRENHFIKHKRNHIKEKLHKCDLCQEQFKYKSDLIIHVMRVHWEKITQV